jgi:hypothetical protein
MSMESTGGGQSVGYDLAGASVGAFFSCHVKVHVPRRPGSTDSGLFSLSGIIGTVRRNGMAVLFGAFR